MSGFPLWATEAQSSLSDGAKNIPQGCPTKGARRLGCASATSHPPLAQGCSSG